MVGGFLAEVVAINHLQHIHKERRFLSLVMPDIVRLLSISMSHKPENLTHYCIRGHIKEPGMLVCSQCNLDIVAEEKLRRKHWEGNTNRRSR